MNKEGGKEEEIREQAQIDSIEESQNDLISDNYKFLLNKLCNIDERDREGTYFSRINDDPRKEEQRLLYNLLDRLIKEEMMTNPDPKGYNDLMDILDRDEPFLRR